MTGLHTPDTAQPTEGPPAQRDPGPSRAGPVRPQLGAAFAPYRDPPAGIGFVVARGLETVVSDKA